MSGFKSLTDVELEAVERLLGARGTATTLCDRARSGELGLRAKPVEELIELVRRDPDLASRASRGERPH